MNRPLPEDLLTQSPAQLALQKLKDEANAECQRRWGRTGMVMSKCFVRDRKIEYAVGWWDGTHYVIEGVSSISFVDAFAKLDAAKGVTP